MGLGVMGLAAVGALEIAGRAKDAVTGPAEATEKQKAKIKEERVEAEKAVELAAQITAGMKEAMLAVEEKRAQREQVYRYKDKVAQRALAIDAQEAAQDEREEKATDLAKALGELVDKMASLAFNRQPYGPLDAHDAANAPVKREIDRHTVEQAIASYDAWGETPAAENIMHHLRELAKYDVKLFETTRVSESGFKEEALLVAADNSRHIDSAAKKLRRLHTPSQITDARRDLGKAARLQEIIGGYILPKPPDTSHSAPPPRSRKTQFAKRSR